METIKLTIPQSECWSDEILFQFCMENPTFKIERNRKGEFLINPLAGGINSICSGNVFYGIEEWNRISSTGITLVSSLSYILPDSSLKSPSVSWISKEKWNKIPSKELEQFPRLCPEVIVEVKPYFSSIPPVESKMESWIQNGVLLGWLVDPKTKKVWVYSPDHPVGHLLPETGQLEGGNVLPGFTYSLQELFSQV